MSPSLFALVQAAAAADSTPAYGHFPGIGARGAVWITAEVHLMFAAFVLKGLQQKLVELCGFHGVAPVVGFRLDIQATRMPRDGRMPRLHIRQGATQPGWLGITHRRCTCDLGRAAR